MSTLSEIVYNLRNLATAGRLSDDSIITFNQLKFIVNYKRAQYLRQDYNKNYFDNDFVYQDLGCLEMELADEAECCHFETGCQLFRTKNLLPEFVKLVDRFGIKVNAINKTKRFELVLPERFPFVGNTKYPSLTEKIFYLNNRLYSKNLYALNVRGILVNPIDARGFVCGDGPCYTEESQYPITADMLELITKDIMQTELKILLMTGQDFENNAKYDNTLPNSTPQ
jgi:hypothetical protein